MPIRRQKSARGQGDRLRRDLLEAAANLMATHGDIESVSLRAVAREAGVSATAVYRHFDDHHDLLRESVEYCWTNFRQALIDSTVGVSDPFDRARATRRRRTHSSRSTIPGSTVMFSNRIELADADSTIGLAAYQLLVDAVAASSMRSVTTAARTSSPPSSTRGCTARSTCVRATPRCDGRAPTACSTACSRRSACAAPPPTSDRPRCVINVRPRAHIVHAFGGAGAAQDSLRPRNRATLRKPVWATIRWSGRTAWPSMCQPRWSTSIVRPSIHLPFEGFAHLCGLRDRWRVGDEQSAGGQHRLGVGHHLPRFGKVEHDPVERTVGGVDPGVAVADVDLVAIECRRAEETLHVLAGPVGEVLADLVADDLRAVPQHRHRQRARADAALEDPHPGPMSARMQIGPRSFG